MKKKKILLLLISLLNPSIFARQQPLEGNIRKITDSRQNDSPPPTPSSGTASAYYDVMCY